MDNDKLFLRNLLVTISLCASIAGCTGEDTNSNTNTNTDTFADAPDFLAPGPNENSVFSRMPAGFINFGSATAYDPQDVRNRESLFSTIEHRPNLGQRERIFTGKTIYFSVIDIELNLWFEFDIIDDPRLYEIYNEDPVQFAEIRQGFSNFIQGEMDRYSRALGRMPQFLLQEVEDIYVSNNSRVFNSTLPAHYALSGKRAIYMDSRVIDYSSLEENLLHEMGHIAHFWYGDAFESYKAIVQSEQHRITDYAFVNDNEDFAETIVAWVGVNHSLTNDLPTEDNDKVKRDLPMRFQFFEDNFGSLDLSPLHWPPLDCSNLDANNCREG